MKVRCCTNPKCKAISPRFTCPICDTPTQPLPIIHLGVIGIHAQVSLHHLEPGGYHFQLDKPSGRVSYRISPQDLKHNNQPHLPHIEPVSNLMVLDSLKDAAGLVAQKNPMTWCGWIAYLLERLRTQTDEDHYQKVLHALLSEIAAQREKHGSDD